MQRLFALIAASLVAAAAVSAGEAPPTFTAKPTAARAGDKVRIEFAADRETDAAVYVLDAQGKAVRHLAAGVLGPKAPEPLKPGLAQSVEWDGRDDAGKPAAGGPFKVRVTLGMKPEFDGFLMFNPDASGPVSAVAVGPGGTLYAFHRDGTANGNMGGHKLKVYSREGKHLRALAPFPADIAPDKVKALGVFQTPEGDLVPRVHNYETLSFYPDAIGSRGRDMPEYMSPAADAKGRVWWLVLGPRLCCVDADGSVPFDPFLGPKLLPEVKNLRMVSQYMFGLDGPCLASSSDGKHLYLAGLWTGEFDKKDTHKPLPCVFRVSAETRSGAEAFLGKPDSPGKEKELLAGPRGLAVAKELVYVADPGADRVVVFKEADRSYAGEIKVASPQSIGVDPASGAVYVCAYTGKQTADLIKFSGYENAKEICRLALPKTGLSPNYGVHRIAVDASAKPVLIWVPGLPYGPPLTCIEDAGDKFVDRGDPRGLTKVKEPWAEGPRDLSVDRLRDELYVKANGQQYYRFDDRTGKLKDVVNLDKIPNNVNSTQLVPGTDGNLYTDTWSSGLWRLDRQGKPLKWDGRDNHIIPIGGVMCFQERHLALRPYAPPDELYLVPPGNYLDEKARMSDTALNVYGQDGKPKRTAVWQCSHGAVPRVDPKGNIYLADLVKPPERSYPEFFDGKLDPPPKEGSGGDRFWNSYIYASIIKFPPTGGIIWYRKNLPPVTVGAPPAELLAKPKVAVKFHWAYSPHMTGELQGALWYRFGFAPFSAHTSGMTSHCMCEGCGFDVDDFGRVFYPNLGQFRVEMVDTNNNWIGAFGKYGNEDSGGPAAKVKKPEIPLAWPCYVAVSDTHAYVADTVNRRVVRVRLGAAAEETCEVR